MVEGKKGIFGSIINKLVLTEYQYTVVIIICAAAMIAGLGGNLYNRGCTDRGTNLLADAF